MELIWMFIKAVIAIVIFFLVYRFIWINWDGLFVHGFVTNTPKTESNQKTMTLRYVESDLEVTDVNQAMQDAGIDHRMRFEDIGIQGDGTLVIYDKCGNFGYLPPDTYYIEYGNWCLK